MLLGAALSLLVCVPIGFGLRRNLGPVTAVAVAGFAWSLVVIGLVTLIPAYANPGFVPAEGRMESCARDIGGPAPDGFWIFRSGQRALNTVLFVPSGALLVLAAARRPRTAVVPVLLGLGLLAAYSGVIELVQLELARLDRACDLTDLVDNVTGAGIGAVLGLGLGLLLRPWRHRRGRQR